MKQPSDAFNRHQDKGWYGKLMHFTGFIVSVPSIGGDNTAVQDWVGWADLIIFQRNIVVPEAVEAIKYWMGLGKPIAIDLDDAYNILPWSNPAHKFWHENGVKGEEAYQALENGDRVPMTPSLKVLEEGLRASAGLISPNRNLLNGFRHCIGDKGYYLQNYAERDWWENLPKREELKAAEGLDGKIVIGWGGSISHYDSFWGSGVFEALERVCRQYDNVVVKICGNDPRIYERLNVSVKQKRQQEGVPAEEWPRQVKSFDIGLAPLFGFYDQNRSWIKGIEYLLAGAPWVGTSSGKGDGTYADLAGMGYLIENSVENWENALVKIIDNLEAEQKRAAEMIPMAQKQFIVDYNLDVYARVYKRIIKDFQESSTGFRAWLPGVIHVE